ncbi:SMI1-KNR4 cell-wall [Singulisphaera sp. GP187]|uniref:SMI1/KNR4 family protein n=1 Tax=Singulisphaera sp. GP187 TaxID=1882752 RepID=UPI00092A3AB1|nr:SMI1/KNR4 family protein [Singulisphaera sp. GP187]SIN91516.1 SMI1-KNR4 cell-wall [Singulisphaera sp. GP187]
MNDYQLRLLAEAPPPACPVNAGSPEQWDEVEAQLGTVLPGDYKWLINTYGSGDFCDLLGVLNPFSSSESGNLLSQVDPILEHYREGPGFQIAVKRPFPAYPERGGLLPVARDSNGDDLFWLTRGEPDDWTLVHYNWRGGWEYQQYYIPLAQFIAEWVSGLLPESFFGGGSDPKIIRRDPTFCPAGQVRPRRSGGKGSRNR